MLQQLIHDEIPIMRKRKFATELLEHEAYWRQLVRDRRLGGDVVNPIEEIQRSSQSHRRCLISWAEQGCRVQKARC